MHISLWIIKGIPENCNFHHFLLELNNAESKIELITIDEVEKAIRIEQDKHIEELAKLDEVLGIVDKEYI